MSETLGKAVLELDADLAGFEKDVRAAKKVANELREALEALAAVANVAERELNRTKLGPAQAAASDASASAIISGVRGISEEARDAARELDEVKLDQAQAVESKAAAEEISSGLNQVSRNADQAKRKLAEVRLAGGRNGTGVGPFGSGFGRIGVLGTAIGAGVLTTPAAAPAALGALTAATAAAAPSAVGALGALALAFQGVGKAIGGDKKAYDDLMPAQQAFVLQVRSLHGWLDKLKQVAGANMFPGLTDALHSALSPGTLSAITRAVGEFGRAIGAAGAAWGRYFGSTEFQSIFGPLMESGARTVTSMSDALLHLFDALGVVLRAAIPLTDWLLGAIDRGSRFADSWLHAKDATGSLGRAFDEMKVSMQLVGGLFASLLRAVGALGQALYPVSKIAVKDLTDGLNALAGIFHRNEDAIRSIVSTALTGLVTSIKIVVEAVRLFNEGLQHVIGNKAGVVTAVLAIGAALALALGPESAVIAGAILSVGLITKHWGQIVNFFKTLGQEILNAFQFIWVEIQRGAIKAALAMVEPFSHLPAFLGGWARDAKTSMQHELDKLQPPNMDWGFAAMQAGASAGSAWRKGFDQVAQNGGVMLRKGGQYVPPPNASTATLSYKQLQSLWVKAGGSPGMASTMAAIALAESGGNVGSLNDNAATGDYSAGLWQVNYFGNMRRGRTAAYGSPEALRADPMLNAKAAVAILASQGPGAWSTYSSGAYKSYLPAGSGYGAGDSPWGSQPPWTTNTGPKSKKPKKPAQPTGANLLSEAIRDALQKAKDKATTSQGSVAEHWLRVEATDLEKAHDELEKKLKGSSGKKKAAIQAEIRSIDGQIASVNKQITTNLKGQATAIKQAFSSQISTARSNVQAAFQTLKQALDAQFEAATQGYIDSVLGPRFFQGTDTHGMPLRTPAEAKYAAEQAADTLKQLHDAISTAADPEAQAAARHQLDLYNDSLAATTERAQADYDYAQAVKKYQADRSELERQMNLQLDTFAKGLANGTTKLSDLAAVASEWGLSLTADGGIITDFEILGDAVTVLSRVLATEAGKLVGVGDTQDAKDIRAIISRIDAGIPSGIAGGDAHWSREDRISIPSLDMGGLVTETGLAVVHRGETFSGVGGGDMQTLRVGSVGNEVELGLTIGRLMQKANKNGIKFELV